jgi:hypothetical protein
MSEFSDFAQGVGRGLVTAVQTDINVFLMTTAGVVYPIKPLRGLSLALGVYVLLRRADDYAGLFAKKLDDLGQSISVNQLH